MAQTAQHIRNAYNKKTYQDYRLRIRKDSDINARMTEYKNQGNSMNYLLTKLLCEHFGEPFPHPENDN